MNLLNISENIFLFVTGLGLLQGILLAMIIYFHPKSDHSVSKFLAFYIASFSIVMAGPLLLQVMRWQDSFFIAPFPLLAGPMMYFYIRSFKGTITWKKVFPHLVLFITYFFTAFWWISYLGGKYPDAKEFPKEGFNSPLSLIFFSIRYIQLLVYYFFSRRELMSYQKSINQFFSETSRINLQWVKWLITGYLFIIVSSIVIFFFMTKYPESFYILYLVTIAIATPYIYLATYKGITQPTIWQKEPEFNKQKLEEQIHETEIIETGNDKQQNQKQGLSDSRRGEILSKVVLLMEQEKIYQEAELTLQDIADKIQFPGYQVSFAINEGMKKSFYDLVNGYRVEEAKRLLLDAKSSNYTILSVGFEAGFNSKTTFNTVFKKFTGMTPTEFRNKGKKVFLPSYS